MLSSRSGGDWNVYSKDRIVVRQIGSIPIVGLCKADILASNTLYSIWSKTPDSDGNENNELLIKLVDQMITAQEQLDSAISDSDKKFLQQRVDILDKQINTVVYGLYGLTADEVEVVEN